MDTQSKLTSDALSALIKREAEKIVTLQKEKRIGTLTHFTYSIIGLIIGVAVSLIVSVFFK